jgi:predicted ATPase
MGRPLNGIHVSGFKSIRDQTIEFRPLNILIGANGSGKSNLIGVFELLHATVEGRLQTFIGVEDGAERLLYSGRKKTDEISLHLKFARNEYLCVLTPTAGNRLVFKEETVFFQGPGYDRPFNEFLGSGHEESRLLTKGRERKTIADHVVAALRSWRVYHFHDTSRSARVKALTKIGDNRWLREDASNLAAYLYLIKSRHSDHYRNIVEVIRLAAPFFQDFQLEPSRLNPEMIGLEWRERDSDAYRDAHALSDGTLRFICLATLLLQPELPSTILLDEPELGLHPYAIHLFADLLKTAASKTQVLVATQSVTLVDQFDPEDLLIVDRVAGASEFRRPSAADLTAWLEDYTLGELWQKNVFGGRPRR